MSTEKQCMCVLQGLIFLFCVLIASSENAEAQPLRANSSVFCSLYSFGDSFVDPGNNNYISTNARSNFPPYGKDFPNKTATGRFSNGLLFPDFLAYYLGAQSYQLPFLGPSLDYNKSVTAVSFASATSGYDPETANKTKAIQLWKQLQLFYQYKSKLRIKVGKEKANNQIKEAVFYINAGSEDFALNYFQDGKGGQTRIALPKYEEFLLQLIQRYIKVFWIQGARKIAVNGLPPLGCIPIVITNLPSNPTNSSQAVSKGERKCLDYVNDVSAEFNSLLQKTLQDLKSRLPETKIVYIDFEKSLLDIIRNPNVYGFTEVNKGCCGTGLTEVGRRCNQTSPLCADTSKNVFWDAAHPTEKTYSIIFKRNLAAIDALIAK